MISACLDLGRKKTAVRRGDAWWGVTSAGAEGNSVSFYEAL